MKNQINSFKMIKSKNKKREIILMSLTIIIALILVSLILFLYKNFKNDKQELLDALEYCSYIYSEIDINDNIELKDVEKCINLLNKSKYEEVSNSMKLEMKQIKNYIEVKQDINSYFKENILKSSTSLEDILYLNLKSQMLSQKYQLKLSYLLENMEEQYNKINLLNFFVTSMYETDEKLMLRNDLTRDEYEQSVAAYNDVKQQDIKNEYIKYIENADQYLTNKEKIEEERKRQEEIENAWVKLKVPYISQNLNYVYNGCEAASLLMALQYKGYLKNMDIVTYSTNMPKSDDPNTGFYLDIFGKEPRNEAHWIAPKPLVEFGISSSGNHNIIDASGYDLSSLANEIINGNPVVIYLTYDFLEPYNWSKGIPKNLHVQLLSGYNTITQQYLITDPYTRWSGKYEFILSKEDTEYLYNTVGKLAVVVR